MPAATDAEFLKDKQVAFTGRLASMTRKEAVRLVGVYGGEFVASLSRRTSFLVVGQEGWPLRKDGRLTTKLQKARSFQRAGLPILILSEEELLVRLGLDARSENVRRLYPLSQLADLLKVPGVRIRRWMEAGLISPAETVHGVCYFDFRQVTGARTLCDLAQAGVSAKQIRKSLEQLRSWIGDVADPLAQLVLLENRAPLLVRSDNGLAEPTGQMVLEFLDQTDEPNVTLPASAMSVEELFDAGCGHEDAGEWLEAAEAYGQALQLGGPDPVVCFNLANSLLASGQRERAVERFHQVVEMDPTFVEGWNNLGRALEELGQLDAALTAYAKAIDRSPAYVDPHYNLADLLEKMGRRAEARPHWQAYVRVDLHSRWGRYAQARLSALSS